MISIVAPSRNRIEVNQSRASALTTIGLVAISFFGRLTISTALWGTYDGSVKRKVTFARMCVADFLRDRFDCVCR